jgi:hypothetical protein
MYCVRKPLDHVSFPHSRPGARLLLNLRCGAAHRSSDIRRPPMARRKCTVCGSKRWHKEPASGLVACSEGHVLQARRGARARAAAC